MLSKKLFSSLSVVGLLGASLAISPLVSAQETNTSLDFNGTGTNYVDRVEIPILNDPTLPYDSETNSGNKLNIGAGDFSIEFWMKAAAAENTPVDNGTSWISGNIILDRDVLDNTNNEFGLSLHDGNIRFGAGEAAGGTTLETTGVDVADSQWHHVAVTRQVSDGATVIYVDGTQRASGTTQAGDISYRQEYAYNNSGYDRPECQGVNKNPYLVLGAEKHDYLWCTEAANPENNAYNGLLDDLRISSSVKYTTDFTLPTSPYGVDGDTVALFRFNEGSGAIVNDAAPTTPVNGDIRRATASDGPQYSTDVPFETQQELPVGVADAYTVSPGSTLAVAAPGVLQNDTGTGSLSAALDVDVNSGTLILNANGSFTYTPDAGFSGTDAFTYIVSNETGPSDQITTVTLNVTFDFSAWATDANGRTNLPYEMASFNDGLYQSHVGTNNRIYTRSTDAQDVYMNPAAGWTGWTTSADPFEFTGLPLTMSSFGSNIYHTHIGKADSAGRQKIYTRSSNDGVTWSGWTAGTDPFEDTKYPIGMTEFGSSLYQVHVGTDNRIYTRSSEDGTTWTDWTKGTDPFENTQFPVKMTAFESNLYQVHVGTDFKIYTRSSTDGITWTGWTKGNDPLEFTSSTVEIKSAGGNLYEVHRGSNNRIYTRVSEDGTTWTPWIDNGGDTNLPVAMTDFGGDLYQGHVASDGRMLWRRLDLSNDV